ncbi:hypothetical protein Ddye_026219 [Dipteronia dyeriana]|uniref:Uncharacterized protein n=1 Tax=Dipteronia dyeriana TaxID=168575 RepID=A0AAD9TLS5_9ROSI|nr:hypothetical protein Ddye_026219 [Dipteronia dyeriana]
MKSGSSSPSNSSSQSVEDVSSNRRQPMEGVGNTKVRKQSAIKPRRKSLDPRDLLASSPPWPTIGIPVLNRKEEDRESVSGDWVDKRSRSEVASTTDDSDHEAANSDCSEPDSLLHFNIQKASSIPSGSLIPSLIHSPPTQNLKSSLSLNKSGRQPLVTEGKRKTGHENFRVYHGGEFNGNMDNYIWGTLSYFDYVNLTELSLLNLDDIAMELRTNVVDVNGVENDVEEQWPTSVDEHEPNEKAGKRDKGKHVVEDYSEQ